MTSMNAQSHTASQGSAAPATLVRTPPMGWNSWDCYGTTVTESEVIANAQAMASRLSPAGWDHIVVDIQWYEPNARAGGYNDQARVLFDRFGRQLPVPARFPSALNQDGENIGFTELARQVHELGLKFGIHLMRGIPRRAVEANTPVFGTPYTAQDIVDLTSTCPWNSDNYGLNHDHPGAQAYYNSQIDLFARWGIDFIKIDDMLFPFHERAIEGYAQAISASGRDITLSLSPGTNVSLNRQPFLSQHATMWRISDDLWDRWEDVLDQFDRLAQWAPSQSDGSWADADMLPLGQIGLRAERGEPRETRLSITEQRTLMSLWSIAKSPLMMGGDLASSGDHTFDLLTNSRLMAMYRYALPGRQIHAEPGLRVWVAPSREIDGPLHVAVFNMGDHDRDWIIDLADLTPQHQSLQQQPGTHHQGTQHQETQHQPASQLQPTPQSSGLSTQHGVAPNVFTRATDIWTDQPIQIVGNGVHPYPHIAVSIPAHGVTHLELM